MLQLKYSTALMNNERLVINDYAPLF